MGPRVFAALLCFLAACRSPTQVTVEIATNLSCDDLPDTNTHPSRPRLVGHLRPPSLIGGGVQPPARRQQFHLRSTGDESLAGIEHVATVRRLGRDHGGTDRRTPMELERPGLRRGNVEAAT